MRAIAREALTEDALVDAIANAIGEQPRPLRVGIGDDAAVWQPNAHHLELITCDMLIDGVHFRLHETPPEALGHKALAKSLSDVAAMAGRPILAVVALGIVPGLDETWYRAFYRGMAALARASRCAIGGGDIVRAPALSIAVTVVGEARRSSLRLRSGARAGDVLAVTGPLGLGAAGLLANAHERAARAYLTPRPRLAEGAYLGSRRAVHALMDLSDGLSTDLPKLARASGVDGVVDVQALYVHDAVRAAGGQPLDLILNGGDDYELLAAVDRRAFGDVARGFERRFGRPLSPIGRVERGAGAVWLERGDARTPLPTGGYDHIARMRG